MGLQWKPWASFWGPAWGPSLKAPESPGAPELELEGLGAGLGQPCALKLQPLLSGARDTGPHRDAHPHPPPRDPCVMGRER